MATNTHITIMRAGFLLAALLAAAITALGLVGGAAARPDTLDCGERYGWPVKPFDRPHPVRGSFGDPRTVFRAPPTVDGMLTGDGSFSFHQGVDISAPNGSPVYPVSSGVVSHVSREWVRVDCGSGRGFEYWHIHPEVRLGQQVEAGRTVLGRILRPAEHVHLTQLANGRAVNPLVRGRLTPYEDETRPWIASMTLRRAVTGPAELPSFVRGRIHLVVEAYDSPNQAVPGNWNGMPVSPARITWHVETLAGTVVLRERAGRDVRNRLPLNSEFWRYYARGTYQNMAVFGQHYSFRQGGSFLFRLTRGPFDTKRLRDGVYDLVVTAGDIRGNQASARLRFTVHNRPGWIGS
jgi:hypothetical protein